MPKLILLSDTHGDLPKIEESCDLVIHAGDICPDFRSRSIGQAQWLQEEFQPWLTTLPAPFIGVWGNHDWIGEHAPVIDDTTFLTNDGIEQCGLNIWGSPFTPEFCGWALMRSEEVLDQMWAAIPDNLDILIVHGPPYGHCDQAQDGYHCGSKALHKHILRAQPRYVICGHIHEGYGSSTVGTSQILNVASKDERYHLRSQPYRVLEI